MTIEQPVVWFPGEDGDTEITANRLNLMQTGIISGVESEVAPVRTVISNFADFPAPSSAGRKAYAQDRKLEYVATGTTWEPTSSRSVIKTTVSSASLTMGTPLTIFNLPVEYESYYRIHAWVAISSSGIGTQTAPALLQLSLAGSPLVADYLNNAATTNLDYNRFVATVPGGGIAGTLSGTTILKLAPGVLQVQCTSNVAGWSSGRGRVHIEPVSVNHT